MFRIIIMSAENQPLPLVVTDKRHLGDLTHALVENLGLVTIECQQFDVCGQQLECAQKLADALYAMNAVSIGALSIEADDTHYSNVKNALLCALGIITGDVGAARQVYDFLIENGETVEDALNGYAISTALTVDVSAALLDHHQPSHVRPHRTVPGWSYDAAPPPFASA